MGSENTTPRETGWRSIAAALGFALRQTLTVVRCAACAAPIARRALLCGPCAHTVNAGGTTRLGGLPVHAYGLYGGALVDAIRALKFRDRPDLGRDLGALLAGFAAALPRFDVVVPVPLHPRRLAERGYNQAALLAAPVARGAGCAFAPRALARTRCSAAQASLDRAGRAAIAGAFEARRPAALRDRRVLLVDDVATTGATLAACAAAAGAAGARSVEALVVARRELT